MRQDGEAPQPPVPLMETDFSPAESHDGVMVSGILP